MTKYFHLQWNGLTALSSHIKCYQINLFLDSMSPKVIEDMANYIVAAIFVFVFCNLVYVEQFDSQSFLINLFI